MRLGDGWVLEPELRRSLASRLSVELDCKGYIPIPAECERLKIDVGLSHDAIHSLAWLKKDSHLFVIGFEPLLENVESIRSIIRKLHPEFSHRFLVIPCAMGNYSGGLNIFVTEDVGQASFLRPKNFDVSEERWVAVEKLDSLVALLEPGRFSRIDFLKTDCQGTDIQVVRGAARTLPQVAVVTVESDSSSYEGSENQESSIARVLEGKGFVRHNPPSTIQRIIRFGVGHLPGFLKQFVGYAHSKLNSRTNSLVSSEAEPSVNTADPTWLNPRFESLVSSGEITAHQFN